MRYAVIDASGSVVNVILWDALAAPDFTIEGHTLVAADEAGPGWTYDGTSFIAPPPPPEPAPKATP